MTVKKEATIQRWIGLSTDTKPTGVAVGSTFFEYDTKLLYVTYDGDNWVIKSLPYGMIFAGTCDSGMTASQTTVVCADLAGYGNDYFNARFYMQVIKNANAITTAPVGEYRLVTDYVSTTGTFTVDAFSANVEESDEVWVVHESLMWLLKTQVDLDYFILADMDDFDVADADFDTDRWTPGYLVGTEGGSGDINTTVSGKGMVKVDPDATPTEARYAAAHALPFYADFFTVIADLDCTWGATDSVAAKALGLLISKGTAYDATNLVAIERQKGTAINRFTARAVFNNVAQTSGNANTTDNAAALKIERWDNVWRCYYSTAQYPNYDWVLLAQFEDSSVYMTNQVTCYLQAYSPGSADAESAQGDFDNFRYYVGAGGGGQFIAGDYDSSWVSADIDGNVFERQEAVQKAMGVVAAAGGQFEADGVPDLWDALVVDSSSNANIVGMTGNRDGAVIERAAAIANALGITDAATLTGFEEDGSGANLFKTLIAVQSVTTGAGSTTTIADTARTEGVDFWNGNIAAIVSGAAAGQVAAIVDDDGAGTLTLRPALTAAPGASAVYVILKQADMPVPAADATDNYQPRDVVGNKTDAADYTKAATASSIIAFLKGLMGAKIIAEGTFTTSSATVPADTGKTEANDYWNGCLLMPVAGGVAFQPRLIVDFANAGGVFTVDPELPFTAATGTVAYVILSNQADLAPAADSTNTRTAAVTIGNKADAAPAMNAAPAATDSAIMHLKALRETVGQEPADGDDSLHTITGQRDDTAPAMNAAPTDTDTVIKHLKAIRETVGQEPADADDSLHTITGQRDDAIPAMNAAPSDTSSLVMHLKAILERVGATPNDADDSVLTDLGQRDDAATADAMGDIATTSVMAKLRLILNRLSSDAFTATIQGSARTELDTMLAQLATYISAGGAAYATNLNGSARTDIETTLEDIGAILSGAGISTFPAAAAPADGVSLAEAIHYIADEIDSITGATGIAHEQADAAVNITAIAASETNVFDLSTAATRYIVRNLRLKAADPGVQILTVRLYELINDVATVVDTFTITTNNFGIYFGLVDMFGVPQLAGDSLKVTVQMDGGAGCAVTGQYSHAKTNV